MAETRCKYYKQKRQVSYDGGATWQDVIPYQYQRGELYEYESADCGALVVYRWVNMDASVDYYCEGTTKYYKQKKQVSFDGGQTWQDVTPPEYQKGGVAEEQSTDCGYVPPGPSPYESQYFTIVPRENGAIRFTTNSYYYSMDSGSTWSKGRDVLDLQLTTGNKVMLKGSGIGTFQTVFSFDVEGNIMSLVFGDNFVGKTDLSSKRYGVLSGLFYNCSGLVNAGNLILPATVLIGGCYGGMFQNCTSLTTVPELPATTLADNCYVQMFDGCTSLTTAPALPATTLADDCYDGMFYGCTSLTTAPELPATTLADNCYQWMFRDCTSLNYIKCLATNISASNCTNLWVTNVPSGGTFVTPSSTNWSTGDSGIPTGWTRVNA